MATVLEGSPRAARPLRVDGYERFLAVGAGMLLLIVLAALARGYPRWAEVPVAVWLHLLTIVAALALTPVILMRPRGDARHRWLGKVWLACLLLTALVTFFIRQTNGGFSLIHVLSVWTVVQVPVIWWTAHTHKVVQHRRAVRGMITGALLVAGFFTLPFGRMLGSWLTG